MVGRISPKIVWSQRLDEGYPHLKDPAGPIFVRSETDSSSSATAVTSVLSDKSESSSDKKRILIADDEPMILTAMSRCLRRYLGLAEEDLITVGNFESARQCFDLQADQIKVVLTDMNMPGHGDGLRLYRHVREKGTHYPLAVVSGGMRDNDQRMLDEILSKDPNCRFYEKPPNWPLLAEWVRSVW